jgi:hypothetical protein
MEMGFTIKQDVDRYKDVSIDSAKLAMKSTDPNSPQGQMINAMYGDGFDYRWGTVDGLFVCAVGGDVNSTIREMIDEVKADSPKQMAAEMKTALTLLAETGKADFVGTYNFLRWLKMLVAMVPVPMPPAQMDMPTKSNIAFAAKAGNGRMVVDIVVPKEHLMEIMAASLVIQQQMMQQQMMQQQMKEMPMPAEPTMPQSWWTCPMHPQVHMPQKGECPICGMNLIPLKSPPEERQQ